MVNASRTDDEVVASLLVLHGLHPDPLARRVEKALARVRPYLGSHGGDVELVAVDETSGVVRLRMTGTCDGCPSSALTLKLAVESAVRADAPEIVRIEVDGAAPPAGETTSRPPAPGWVSIADVPEPGRLAVREVAGTPVVVCRVDGRLYAYRDVCPACDATLGEGRLAGPILTCVDCGRRYDVRRAGRTIDDGRTHLVPVPLLEEASRIALAVDGAAP